jgi:hypothetical protein
MESDSRMNGTTVSPSALSCSISASTITFSPDGAPLAYRLCAITTFMAPSGFSAARWKHA